MGRYSQLGEEIFVGISGLMEHFLSLVSLGLFTLRVALKGGRRKHDHCPVFWISFLFPSLLPEVT